MRQRSPKGEIKTTCSKCNDKLEPERYSKYRYCRKCHAAHMRKNRPKHSELTDDARLRANARSYTHEYIKRGKIKRNACVKCGNEQAEVHHSDYTKPLEIIWLCRKCHILIHKKIL